MSKDIKKIAATIAKCLALASSSNSTEAQTARRQAESLMKKYNLTGDDVLASQVSEQVVKTTSKFRTPIYLCDLASIIAQAFGTKALFMVGNCYYGSTINFLGLGVKPEMASYTYTVLARQLKKDRKTYRDSLYRYKPKNKIRMADIFCRAWVIKISDQVHDFAGSEQEKAAISAYCEQKYPTATVDTRKNAKIEKDSDFSALRAGVDAAADVRLHKPVQTQRDGLLLGMRGYK